MPSSTLGTYDKVPYLNRLVYLPEKTGLCAFPGGHQTSHYQIRGQPHYDGKPIMSGLSGMSIELM